MSFQDDAQDVLDSNYDTFGTAAVYTPPGGSPVSCTVIPHAEDRTVSFGDGRPFAQGTILKVRSSEIAEPVEGGTFVPGTIVDGAFVPGTVTLAIIGDPQQPDGLRLEWSCRVN